MPFHPAASNFDEEANMTLDRRTLIRMAAGGFAAAALPSQAGHGAAPGGRIEAVAFDAFPILDPWPVFALAETLFPGRGTELSNVWRSRQFEYQWLRALGGRYENFSRTTEDALIFAARQLGLELTDEKRAKLTHAYLELKAWPDVPAALQGLRSAGVRLAFLSNMTPALLD